MWGKPVGRARFRSKPSPNTPITRTSLEPVQFSASPLSELPNFSEQRKRGWSFSIQGSVRGTIILDLSHVVYFLSPAPLSPPQTLPLGIPIKIAVMEKQEARGGRWEEVKDGSLPLPIVPRVLFFFLPSLARTQRGLYGGESRLHSLSHRGLYSSKLCLSGLRYSSRPSSSKDD